MYVCMCVCVIECLCAYVCIRIDDCLPRAHGSIGKKNRTGLRCVCVCLFNAVALNLNAQPTNTISKLHVKN